MCLAYTAFLIDDPIPDKQTEWPVTQNNIILFSVFNIYLFEAKKTNSVSFVSFLMRWWRINWPMVFVGFVCWVLTFLASNVDIGLFVLVLFGISIREFKLFVKKKNWKKKLDTDSIIIEIDVVWIIYNCY